MLAHVRPWMAFISGSPQLCGCLISTPHGDKILSKVQRIVNFVDGTVKINNLVVGTCSPLTYTYAPDHPTVAERGLTVDMPDDKYVESPKPPKDPDRWSLIKKSGAIKMTPLTRKKSQTRYYPVQTLKYAFALGWPSCSSAGKPTVFGSQVKAISMWSVNVVPSDLAGMPDLTSREGDDVPDIAAELNSLRSDVVASNLMTYDLLTELAEAQKTAKLILTLIQAVRHPIQSFLDFRRTLLKNGKLSPKLIKEALEKKWMEYRYAIMPLAYSVQDAMKLAKEKGDIYKTDRKSREFSYTTGSRPSSSQNSLYSWTSEEVQVRISVVGRARFDPDELYLRLFDQIGINPFKTAWELIPYSFVIDWFANIGDWVLARTAGLGPGAQQRLFCQSIKEIRTVSTYVVDEREWKASKEYSAGVVSVGPFVNNSEGLLIETKEESYTRSLFTTDDVHLQFDAYLNWKRMIDGWVLSQKPLIKALRKLK